MNFAQLAQLLLEVCADVSSQGIAALHKAVIQRAV